MNVQKVSSQIGSWTLLLLGVGHTATYLLAPKTIKQTNFITEMKAIPIEMMGSKSDLFSFHHGFSLMMGLLLIGYGLINILIIKHVEKSMLPKAILSLNIFISVASFILCYTYFFIVPILFTAVSTLAFTCALIVKSKK